MRLRILYAMLLSVVVGQAALCSPLPRVGLTHDFVWTEEKDIPMLIQALKDARVQAVRMPVRWTICEPERGKWDFSRLDKAIRMLRKEKIEILAVLTSVPEWASGIDRRDVSGFWDMFPPKNESDWAEFVRRCVTRYRNHIRYWEIWNEQDGVDWYKPFPNPRRYVKLLKASYTAAKAADPGATVVLGSLQMNGIIANPWSQTKIENFLQKLYDAGCRPYCDAINIHPYVTPAPDQGASYCAKLVRDTVKVMQANGDSGKPLWITETGTFTAGHFTEEEQAAHLTSIYRELDAIPQVKLVYWFCLRDFRQTITGGEQTMGIIAYDGRRKPAFDAFRAVAEHYAGVTVDSPTPAAGPGK